MLKNTAFILFLLFALGTSASALAAELAPVEVVPVQTMPASLSNKEVTKHSTTSSRPINDNHVDFRHCLELTTNQEIAQCRYKKK